MKIVLHIFFLGVLNLTSLYAQVVQEPIPKPQSDKISKKTDLVSIDKFTLLNFSFSHDEESDKVVSFKVKIQNQATILNTGNRFNAKTQSLIRLAQAGTEVVLYDITYKTDTFDKPLTFLIE